jgi:TRAP-type C4-dicarboxylate transport system substrate-binding protein
MLGLRATLSTWVTAVLICALVNVGAAGAQTVTLKFSQFLGPKSFFQVDVLEPWARELETRTNGAIKVEIFDGSTPLGKVTEQADNVLQGKVDIALGLRGAEGKKFPLSSLIELPFVVPNADKGSRALWALYKDGTLAAEYSDFKLLALFVHNPGLIHTKDKAVRAPADMNGLRFRSPNNTVSEALKHMGAVPVLLQTTEVPAAVTAGRLDGVITNWGNPIQGFNDFMKYHTDVKFYASAFFIVMNKAKYESLPAELRAAVDAISGDAWVAKFGAYWDKWDAPVRQGARDHQIIAVDETGMTVWQAALKPVSDAYIDSLAAGGSPGARAAYDRLLQLLR